VALETASFLVQRRRLRLGNGPLLQVLEVTTIGSHSGSQWFIFH